MKWGIYCLGTFAGVVQGGRKLAIQICT